MSMSSKSPIPTPYCHNMQEHPDAVVERLRLSSATAETLAGLGDLPTALSNYIWQGLAYTVGSALESTPPTMDECLAAFVFPNKAGLTAGSRAWSKHAHRSQSSTDIDDSKKIASRGWWGTPSGPVADINSKSLLLFWKVVKDASWRNLHWLPHRVLVYEVRVAEGYGMRWSQDHGAGEGNSVRAQPWIFRGFVEPMMENGHEVGWKH